MHVAALIYTCDVMVAAEGFALLCISCHLLPSVRMHSMGLIILCVCVCVYLSSTLAVSVSV